MTQSESAWWARYAAAENDFERALLASIPDLSDEDLRKICDHARMLLVAGIAVDAFSYTRVLLVPPRAHPHPAEGLSL